MTEMLEEEMANEIVKTESKIGRIRSIAGAWKKIENDENYSDEQKMFVTTASMSEVFRITKGETNE